MLCGEGGSSDLPFVRCSSSPALFILSKPVDSEKDSVDEGTALIRSTSDSQPRRRTTWFRHVEQASWREFEVTGLVSFMRCLGHYYGYNFVGLIFIVEHLMKGFVDQFLLMAAPYMFKAYHVPAPQVSMFTTVTSMPWALKPVLGLISDVLPLFGYHKAPWMIISSVMGTAGVALIWLADMSPIPFVICSFVFTVQVVWCDLMTQATYTRKVQLSRSPSKGKDLLAFVWFGTDAGALVGTLTAGFTIASLGARGTYAIATFPALLSMAPVLRGHMEEGWSSPEQVSEIRGRFWEQREACSLVLVMFAGTLVISLSIILCPSIQVNATVSLVVFVTVLTGFTLVLSPVLAKIVVYAILIRGLCLQINSATFYFFTDEVGEYATGPNFSKVFFNSVLGSCDLIFFLVGIYTYHKLSAAWTYRRWLLLANFAHAFANLLYVLLFLRVNLRLGIPDWLAAVVASALVKTTERWRDMAMFVLFSYCCPRGMEATTYALLMGCYNLGGTLAGTLGGLILKSAGCTPAGLPHEADKFQKLWLVAGWSSVVPLAFSLLFYWLVPNMRQNVSVVEHLGQSLTAGSQWNRLRKSSGF